MRFKYKSFSKHNASLKAFAFVLFERKRITRCFRVIEIRCNCFYHSVTKYKFSLPTLFCNSYQSYFNCGFAGPSHRFDCMIYASACFYNNIQSVLAGSSLRNCICRNQRLKSFCIYECKNSSEEICYKIHGADWFEFILNIFKKVITVGSADFLSAQKWRITNYTIKPSLIHHFRKFQEPMKEFFIFRHSHCLANFLSYQLSFIIQVLKIIRVSSNLILAFKFFWNEELRSLNVGKNFEPPPVSI